MIPEANITLKGKKNTLDMTTDKNGHIKFQEIPEDEYTIIVEKLGYETYTSEPVVVDKNTSLKFNVKLEPAVRDVTINLKPKSVKQALIGIKAEDGIINEPDVTEIHQTLDGDDSVTFKDVPYGKYTITVKDASGYKDYTSNITINKSNKNPRKVVVKLSKDKK